MCAPFHASVRHTFPNASTSRGKATPDAQMTRRTPHLSGRRDIVQCNSSWAVRVNREDLLTIQVDGTEGSAVAGLRDCKTQHRVNTPRPTWNPDIPNPFDFKEQWEYVPDNQVFDNAFKVQWEAFLKHVVNDEPFPWICWKGRKARNYQN